MVSLPYQETSEVDDDDEESLALPTIVFEDAVQV